MGSISENMRTRREAIGLPKSTLARILGVDPKQIDRWEKVNTPPADMIPNIATALGFSISELYGVTRVGLDLSGEWHAVWQTTRDGIETLNRHVLNARHAGEFVYLDADGDYDWRADFRIQGSVLKGMYQAVDEGRNESGVMFMTLNHHGSSTAIGRWTGTWADGICGDGFGVIARDSERADQMMKILLESGTSTIKEWPKEDRG